MQVEKNFLTVGNPTFNNYTVSNFTAINYLITPPFLTRNDISSFEIVVSFKYVDTTHVYTSYACILEPERDVVTKGLRFSLFNSEERYLYVRIANLSITLKGTTQIVSGTKYYAKITFDTSTGYKLYLSTDGINWNLEASNVGTTQPDSNSPEFAIGQNYGHNAFNNFQGEFYLDEWYAKVNNVVVWTPFTNLINSVIVPKGTTVRYLVSKNGYISQTGLLTLTADQTLSVILQADGTEVDVTDYQYSLNGDVLTLTKYIGASGSVVSPNI